MEYLRDVYGVSMLFRSSGKVIAITRLQQIRGNKCITPFKIDPSQSSEHFLQEAFANARPPSLQAEPTPPPRSGGRGAGTTLSPTRVLSTCTRPAGAALGRMLHLCKTMTRGVSGPQEHQHAWGAQTTRRLRSLRHLISLSPAGRQGSAQGAADPVASLTSPVPSWPQLSSEPGSLGHRPTSPSRASWASLLFLGKWQQPPEPLGRHEELGEAPSQEPEDPPPTHG